MLCGKARNYRCLLINAETRETGAAAAATEVRNIFIVNCVVCAGHCGGGVVVRKKRTTVGAI